MATNTHLKFAMAACMHRIVATCIIIAHFFSLKTRLKMRQTMANMIPRAARIVQKPKRAGWTNTSSTTSGTPSGIYMWRKTIMCTCITFSIDTYWYFSILSYWTYIHVPQITYSTNQKLAWVECLLNTSINHLMFKINLAHRPAPFNWRVCIEKDLGAWGRS